MKRKTNTIFCLGCAFLLLLPSLAVAGQLGQGGGSAYPSALDTKTTYTNKADPCVTSISTRICKETFNDPQDAIVKIETELGLLPKGSYATVVARLNAAAYLTTANTFTAAQTLSLATPSFIMTDTTALAKSLTIAVGSNVANFRESAGASGSLLALDLANNRVGIGTASPSYPLQVTGAVAWGTGVSSYMYGNGLARFAFTGANSNVLYSGGVSGFGINNQADTTRLVTVLDSGLVGIGTTSPNVGLEMGATLNVRIPNIKSTTGTLYVCVDTNGTLTKGTSCSGT